MRLALLTGILHRPVDFEVGGAQNPVEPRSGLRQFYAATRTEDERRTEVRLQRRELLAQPGRRLIERIGRLRDRAEFRNRRPQQGRRRLEACRRGRSVFWSS